MPKAAQRPVYLGELSPRDARFDTRRRETGRFVNLYQNTPYQRFADRMRYCSPRLDFAFHLEDNGVLAPKLQAAHFCRVRLCPMCQWRRSVMWQAKALRMIPKVVEAYPKSRFIFLTLTVKNCQLSDLRETLAWMHKSWVKLTKRKEFASVQGWLRSVEVTRGVDDTAHPHYHALLMVKPGYFGGNYVQQSEWTEAWKSCLSIDYTPVVDVRAVRPGRREKDGEEGVVMVSAICEALKYSVKPSDCLDKKLGQKMTSQEWLVELTSQLTKTRAIATGGILKEYLKELEQEPDDLVHADDTGLTDVDETSPRIGFGWRENLGRYVLTEEPIAIGAKAKGWC